jgi:hypothetical protein
MKSSTLLRLVFAIFFFGLITTSVAAQESGTGISGYTSIDYDEDTNTVMAYSETDLDYSLIGSYQAYLLLTVTKDSYIVTSGSARDHDDAGFIALEFDLAGEPGSTYNATGRHRAYAQLWDYDSVYPYRNFYYDNWYFTNFENSGIYTPWYYRFASPGYRDFTRRTQLVSLGSTYDTDSLTIYITNRGTIQAQGPDIDVQTAARANGQSCSGVSGNLKGAYRRGEGTISWSWARDGDVSAGEAASALECIQHNLTSRQLGNRSQQAFPRAFNVISSGTTSGISAPFSRSYHDDGQPDSYRVDVAIYLGRAFVSY